jgi:UDP-N-acetylmuramoyl-tripeptide--D-alanyl-D-alanine ligase
MPVKLTVDQILSVTSGRLAAGSSGAAVSGISTDTRTLKPGDCFFALVGERFDGHRFLPQAADKGAAAVVASDGAAAGRLAEYPGAVIIVADTERALGDLAAWQRRRLRCRVVAITGSCGKTSVKEMLGQILERRLRGHRAASSFNNFVGVPLTIFASGPDDDYLILELGTSAPGEMRRLAEIASPDIAVVTCVGPTHLEGLGSVEGVANEKEELVRSLGPKGLAVLNFDDPHVAAMAEAAKGAVRTFGVTDGDVVAGDVQVEPDRVAFALDSGVMVRLPAPGRHNVLNALAAVTVAREFGLEDEEIAAALARYKPPEMRLVRQTLPGGVTLIDDCYNANPMSSQAALEVLCSQPASGRRVLVQGDMLELGPESTELHARLGQAVAESCVNVLVTVGDQTRETSLAAAAKADLVRFHFPSAQAAAGEVASLLGPGDAVLVKGSRGMALEYVSAAIREAFAAPAEKR